LIQLIFAFGGQREEESELARSGLTDRKKERKKER
jgi:hypothetical protein